MGPTLRKIISRRMLVTFFLGFSSGLPLLTIGGTLQAWMKESHVDLSVIGIFSLVGLPYTLKFLWAPLIDKYTPPFLGRRRGWMLLTQLCVAGSLAALALCEPTVSVRAVAVCALFVAFFSASQDIVLDAHRRDTLHDEELGLGSSLFINGYRIGMLLAGAGALYLADHFTWRQVYFILATSMAIGMVTTYLAPEPHHISPPRTLQAAVIEPLREFFSRHKAWVILAFILFYKLGDSLASAMTTPFFLDLGFSKTEIAAIGKTFGLAATLGGGIVGGIFMLRLGLNKSLWVFGLLQGVSIISFSLLANVGMSLSLLAVVVAFENFCSGMGTSAYVAYMGSVCDRRFSATQYALLSSLMGVPRTLASAPTGFLAQHLGWNLFFVFCTICAVPGILLLAYVAPWRNGASTNDAEVVPT